MTGVPLFSSHMIDLSEEPLAENIEITVLTHPRFFDGQLGSVVGAIDYVGCSGD